MGKDRGGLSPTHRRKTSLPSIWLTSLGQGQIVVSRETPGTNLLTYPSASRTTSRKTEFPWLAKANYNHFGAHVNYKKQAGIIKHITKEELNGYCWVSHNHKYGLIIRLKYGLVIGASLVAQTVKCMPTMRETRVWSLGRSREDPLEKELAAHSSTLAWKIPWTEELGRLQSMRSQRVRHGWATSLSLSIMLKQWRWVP